MEKLKLELIRWIAELEDLSMQINEITEEEVQKMTERNIIIHVLNNLPNEYDIEVAIFEKELAQGELDLEKV